MARLMSNWGEFTKQPEGIFFRGGGSADFKDSKDKQAAEPAQTTPDRGGGSLGVKWPHHGVKGPHTVVKGLIYRCK